MSHYGPEVFVVHERGHADLRDLATVLLDRGYRQADAAKNRLKPGEFVIRDRQLICRQTLADRRIEE